MVPKQLQPQLPKQLATDYKTSVGFKIMASNALACLIKQANRSRLVASFGWFHFFVFRRRLWLKLIFVYVFLAARNILFLLFFFSLFCLVEAYANFGPGFVYPPRAIDKRNWLEKLKSCVSTQVTLHD